MGKANETHTPKPVAVDDGRQAREALVLYRREGRCVRLTLNRPGRGNSLVPEFVEAFRQALVQARDESPDLLLIDAAGKAFSSGGDIAGFLRHADTVAGLEAYASTLVGSLNAAILDLMAFPAPVLVGVQGPVTGGSLGFLLASDIVVMSEAAFVQPYYAEVGFAPDGGWTAMLPRRIGEARALEIQLLNRRVDAWRAHALGLASSVAAADEFQQMLAQHVETLLAKAGGTLAATRALIRGPQRQAEIARMLEAERELFVERVALPEVVDRMRRFDARSAKDNR
ncbi:2-(1,2-epoxy-1,2-dihydrophenyl)acetyl-CoA isomerase [Breoghania corrubedonensis]|uniref:2-(1,2-epoxy-1,2-dihydrophenyl)acetyl-CoA isomerase n=1 Tax=Breoghania corrubedonensis TaxID=665038 RepID=A0A2T5VIF8_9HYPH|nr:enoyl-CoA hydratase/isomerase family protein [Breoghania corrubedonensis]PTW63545.1 2-(1,2-epoxy-1,2-dihydrophenyl)acetyl-CoA isomerase [Breoghania corrubedonensis]